jgi:hypothetical protein
MHMLSAASLQLLLEILSVLVGARSHSHQNAAVADTRFILLDALFRDAPVAKHSNKANRQVSGASAGQCCGYWPARIKPEPGNAKTAPAARTAMMMMMMMLLPPVGPPSAPPFAALLPCSVLI